MTGESRYLQELARGIAAAYRAHARPAAILLTGSIARGESDAYSDIDLIAYYDELPSDEQLRAAHREIGVSSLAPLGPRAAYAVGESYAIEGIDCQVAHILIAHVEEDLTRALEQRDVDDLLQKRLLGLQEGVPLQGGARIRGWQARLADYPEALAEATVRHYLQQLFPVWYYQDYLARRDATLWLHQLLVESAQNILGILAGLNHCYYSTFQLKRMRRLTDQMPIAPEQLADRLESLFTLEPAAAVEAAEELVRETVALVGVHMPGIDTMAVQQRLGKRKPPFHETHR